VRPIRAHLILGGTKSARRFDSGCKTIDVWGDSSPIRPVSTSRIPRRARQPPSVHRPVDMPAVRPRGREPAFVHNWDGHMFTDDGGAVSPGRLRPIVRQAEDDVVGCLREQDGLNKFVGQAYMERCGRSLGHSVTCRRPFRRPVNRLSRIRYLRDQSSGRLIGSPIPSNRWVNSLRSASRSGDPRMCSMHSLGAPTYVEKPSISVAMIQALSSGHR
jgi:hypothetical protein